MDALLSTLGSILVECGRHLCGPVYFNIKNVFKFRSNFDTLRKDVTSLINMKNKVMEEIELEEKNGKIRTPQVNMWLGKVEEIEQSLFQAEVMNIIQRLQGGCFNRSMHYRLSKEVAEKIKVVKQILNESSSLHPPVMVDYRVKAVEQLPGPSFIDQNALSPNLEKILELLNNDQFGIIGIWGMGGVGKTTLMRNLNNHLDRMHPVQPWSIVIWVTVSKAWELGRVQDRIIERLKMTQIKGESMEGKASRLYHRLRTEKFIMILDDVWERIHLHKIGIPSLRSLDGCKIILTTRSQLVCREMETDCEFLVPVLSFQESWALFGQSAGKAVHSEDIRPIAAAVVNEFGGLPLAITTMGRAMRGRNRPELWNEALRALQRSNPLPSLERELFFPLKWSYDSLEGTNIKPCFLSCCLYPEDFSIPINDLVQFWVAEGLIDEREDHAVAYNMGITLIENLKDSCLLERGVREGTVRMHDVVRDVAIWIASSLPDGHKSLIECFGSSRISNVETWGPYKRVSFMYNRTDTLPDHIPECSQLTTLLLEGNGQLELVPHGFLLGFRALRVFNLSETSITSLPPLEHLGELRALFLRNCFHLREFPSLRGLSRLQVLDVSGTSVAMSPDEVGQILDELRLQNHLLEFYVDLYHVPNITSEDSAWLSRLRRFGICIGTSTTEKYLTPHNERAVYICGATVNCLSEQMVALWRNASSLVINRCEDFLKMWTGTHLFGVHHLKSLMVDNCPWPGSMGVSSSLVLFPSLEVLSLRYLRSMWSVSEIIISSGRYIKIIEIKSCNHLTSLFSFNLLHQLESLQEIYVSSCDNLMEIITDCTLIPINDHLLPNLRVMELTGLPMLNSICQQVMPCPRLRSIKVEGCPLLKKLPLSAQHASTMEFIRGDTNWWEQLEWEDEYTKLSLQPLRDVHGTGVLQPAQGHVPSMSKWRPTSDERF